MDTSSSNDYISDLLDIQHSVDSLNLSHLVDIVEISLRYQRIILGFIPFVDIDAVNFPHDDDAGFFLGSLFVIDENVSSGMGRQGEVCRNKPVCELVERGRHLDDPL